MSCTGCSTTSGRRSFFDKRGLQPWWSWATFGGVWWLSTKITHGALQLQWTPLCRRMSGRPLLRPSMTPRSAAWILGSAALCGPRSRNRPFFRPENQSFIYFAFARTVCSTAFVECMFASFNQWMSKSSKPLRLSSLASRHVTHAFMRSWKARVGKQQTPTTGRRICKEARIGFDLMSGRMFFCNL